MKAHEWIDRLKVAKGLPSDYAAAKVLDVTRAAISNYRSRSSTLDDETAYKLANAMEINPLLVLADQVAERVKDDTVQSVWRVELKKLLSKEKAPHLAGLGVGGNGRIRKNEAPKPKKAKNDSSIGPIAILASSLFPTPMRRA